METSVDLALPMAAVSSPLGLCSSCLSATGRAFESHRSVRTRLAREDFWEAQHKCYFCAWFRHSLTSEVLDRLPQSFVVLFQFFMDSDFREPHLYGKIDLYVEIEGYGPYLYFTVNANAGTTREKNLHVLSYPADISRVHSLFPTRCC